MLLPRMLAPRWTAALCVVAAGLPTGMPAVALAQSSSISAEESPPEAPPGVETEEVSRRVTVDPIGLDESGEVTSAQIRDAVNGQKWADALDLVRRSALETDDEDEIDTLRLLEARILVRFGDVGAGVRAYRRLLERPGVKARATAELHDLYVERGRFASADALTEAASSPSPANDVELAALRGYSYSVQGRYREAARITAAGAVSGHPRSQVLRANALLALGNRQEAEELYLQVLREATDRNVRQVAHFGLGQVASIQGGRAVRAVQDERAVRLGPAPWAELDWGIALRALGRRGEARERLEAVAESAPALASTAGLTLARLDEEAGLGDAALERLADAVQGSTSDFLVLTRLGELLLKEGLDEAGVEALRSALQLFPEFPPARERLTRALTALGRWDEAPTDDAAGWSLPGWTWDRLLEGDLPYFPVVADHDSLTRDDPRRFVLALVHLRAANAGGVLGWTEGATATDGLLASFRAEALEIAGRTGDARELWQQIVDAGRGGVIARERLARLTYEEDPDAARLLWRDLLRKYPEYPRVRLRMAEFLEEIEEYEDAIGAYRQAESGGWLSRREKKRIRLALEDLDDLMEEREDAPEKRPRS
ncbi:MAG: tetratricopeptide repeat protein [Gemmatimonadetes bacterium]|nr:tetratricopeptide repeat protein [Gemmatimonadota bacterium]